jgi:four helix bundle protein
MIQSFTELIAWQHAHKLALSIYRASLSFPSEEKFGLTSQLRRAAVSVTSNIAEGFGRSSDKDREHFYTMASGSLYEVKSQLILARDLGYIKPQSFERLAIIANEAHKLTNGLLKKHRAGRPSI